MSNANPSLRGGHYRPAGQRDQLQPSPAFQKLAEVVPAHPAKSNRFSTTFTFAPRVALKGRYCWLDDRQSALSSRNQDSANRRVASISDAPDQRGVGVRLLGCSASAAEKRRQGPVVRLASGRREVGGELAIDDDHGGVRDRIEPGGDHVSALRRLDGDARETATGAGSSRMMACGKLGGAAARGTFSCSQASR